MKDKTFFSLTGGNVFNIYEGIVVQKISENQYEIVGPPNFVSVGTKLGHNPIGLNWRDINITNWQKDIHVF